MVHRPVDRVNADGISIRGPESTNPATLRSKRLKIGRHPWRIGHGLVGRRAGIIMRTTLPLCARNTY
jgi:hypothetical protein